MNTISSKLHNKKHQSKLALGLTFISILIIGISSAFYAKDYQTTKTKEMISQSIQSNLREIALETNESIGLYKHGLQSLRASIKAIGLDRFNYQSQMNYFKNHDFQTEYPGARGFGFIRKVKHEALDDFLIEANKERSIPFNIRYLNANNSDHYIIQYIEPENVNAQAVGLDIASEQTRKIAAINAAITNTTQLTGPITLVQEKQKVSHGFLLLLPVYTNGSSANLIENKNIFGWVYAPLLINEILTAIEKKNENLGLTIVDISAFPPITITSPENNDIENFEPGLTAYTESISLDIYGRQWEITATPNQTFIETLKLVKPNLLFIQIIILTFVLAAACLIIGYFIAKRLTEIRYKVELAAIVENASEAIIGLNTSFCISRWNSAAEILLNLSHTAEQGPLIDWLNLTESNDKLLNIFKKVAKGEHIRDFEVKIKKQNESVQYLHLNFMPIISNNTFYGSTLSIVDVSSLKKLQLELEENNNELQRQVSIRTEEIQQTSNLQKSILNSSGFGVIATDLSGCITLFNKKAEAILQYQAEEVIGNLTPVAFYSPEAISLLNKQIQDEYNQNVTGFELLKFRLMYQALQEEECFFIDKKGLIINVHVTITSILNENQQVFGYLFIIMDINQQKGLELDYELTKASVDNAQDILFWLDETGQIKNTNPYAQIVLGYSYNKLRQINIADIIQFETNESWQTILTSINNQGRLSIERNYKCNSGELIPMLITICQLHAQNKNYLYFSAKNIAERLEKETKLQDALKKADQANNSKVHFLSNMSHELRTPLNAINGMLQLIEISNADETQINNVKQAKNSVKSLTQIIDNIIDLTKADKGQLNLVKCDFDFHELLRETGYVLNSIADSKDLEVHYAIDPNVPFKINGDANRIKQVLLNIVGNAIKFTDQGEIVVSCKIKEKIKEQFLLEISVSDTGIGINKEKLSQIFELFTQLESDNNRNYGGTGLGLTVTSQLIELMQGTITVESEIDKGSIFTFTMLLGYAENQQIMVDSQPNLQDLSVLIIDDNLTALSILTQTAEQLGWTVTSSNSASEALAILKSANQAKAHFDLVLIDWNMPEINGWQLAEQIRQELSIKKLPLVVMVTAYTRKMLAEKNLDHSSSQYLNGFITKPVTKYTLLEAVKDAASVAIETKLKEPNNIPIQHLIDKKILLVEDNPVNQLIAKQLLESEGAYVVVASGGCQALIELGHKTCLFDIVLMDIQMPDLDGYETTLEIRKQPQFKLLPILAMTANVLKSDKEKCLAVGMNDHIGKPFELPDLIDKILRLTGESKQMSLVHSQANTVEHQHKNDQPTIPDAVQQFSEQYNININETLSRFNFKVDLYLLSLELFIADLTSYKNQLNNEALTSEQITIIFHTVKGTSASLGFTDLSTSAKEIERKIIEGVAVAFEPFILLLDKTHGLVAQLIELLTIVQQDKDKPALVLEDDKFDSRVEQLLVELAGSNMKAIDTFKLIKPNLNQISIDKTTELEFILNKLKFKDAKILLTNIVNS